ncbi:MAG TPA: DUF2185 domain-containing protein [Allosphingosinicella sp.]|jgi:hypothetical protein|nr:DUF2185 domain-containing protein [Allosphingosinicella sp.]
MEPAPFTLDDPRENARDAPYTYFLPSGEELAAIEPDDQVKLVFRSVPPSDRWDAERMWVTVEDANGDHLQGRLDNEPSDMPLLAVGAPVSFQRHHVVAINWGSDRSRPPPEPPERREYWDRCMVDGGVLYDEWWVYYLYREPPDLAGPEDKYPDSGWRIRGWREGLTDRETEESRAEYVALGAVLNRDDSWLHLIDAPVGSAFIRGSRDEQFRPTSAATE